MTPTIESIEAKIRHSTETLEAFYVSAIRIWLRNRGKPIYRQFIRHYIAALRNTRCRRQDDEELIRFIRASWGLSSG